MASNQGQQKQSKLGKLGEKLVAGAIAGILGGSITFPLDTIKTRLQNNFKGEYNGIVDVVKKTMAREGIKGFYKGLPAVMVGITPEKAIKLGVNDFAQDMFRERLGKEELSIPYLAASGAIAGTCQVIATNPMEVVKIRMQMSAHGGASPAYGQVLRELGLSGLYTGVAATLLRDVPFSLLYFGSYGYLRQKLQDKDGNLSMANGFVSGLSAGVIASGSVTPADVIKTRLQSPTPAGVEPYRGIADTAARIVAKEGIPALFKGVVPRILVISPLFAITLAIFEIQKTLLNKARH
jgi:solute carrier family 25 aspartate/glutamate transporter 12/13